MNTNKLAYVLITCKCGLGVLTVWFVSTTQSLLCESVFVLCVSCVSSNKRLVYVLLLPDYKRRRREEEDERRGGDDDDDEEMTKEELLYDH